MRVALIANPSSGSGSSPRELARELEALGAEVSLFSLDQREQALAGQPQRIVGAGGDGSLGCCAELAARAGVPLAVVATGTANDFARAFDLPDDPRAACRLAVTGTRTWPLELGRMADRPFVNVASAGPAALAARRAAPLKARLGALSYAVGALRAGATGSPLRCRVRVDGEQCFQGGAWQLIVACTGVFGAGSSLEQAEPDDGRLDVAVVPAGARARLVQRAWGLRSGRVTAQAGVVHARGRVVEVDVAPGTGWNVDGELVVAGATRFEVSPAAFTLVVA